MGRHHRFRSLVVIVVMFAFATTGCVFLDAERRRDFRGPNWDVPFAVPLFAKQTRWLADMADFEVHDEDGTLGYREPLERVEFEVPPGLEVPNFVFEPQTLEVDVVDWPELDGLDILADAFLRLHIVNDAGFDGNLSLKIEGLSDGDVAAKKRRDDVPLTAPKPVDLRLTDIIKARPDKLRFTWAAAVRTGSAPEDGGRFAIAPEVWVPVVLEIGPEGQDVPMGDAVALNLEEDARNTIRDAPLGDVALIVEVDTRLPFSVQLVLDFGAGASPEFAPSSGSGAPPGSGTGSVPTPGFVTTPGSGSASASASGAVLRLSLPAAPTDGAGRAIGFDSYTVQLVLNEAIRSALVQPDASVQTTLTIFGSDDTGLVRLNRDDSIAFKGYVTVTALVNRPR